MAGKFSASARTNELIPELVEIGGQHFKVKRSGKALKRIIGLTPDDDTANDPDTNIESLYKGLSFVLFDEQGNNADADFLEEELDFEVAQELMAKFLPSREESPTRQLAAVPSTPDTNDQG